MSKLTTPFWSRIATIETLRVTLYSNWMICCADWLTLAVRDELDEPPESVAVRERLNCVLEPCTVRLKPNRVARLVVFGSDWSITPGQVERWSEIALHAAMLFPTLAAVLGSYFLAKELGVPPLTAVFAGIFTPVFLISGTSLMCDTMMVSWWVWAVYFWVRGMENDRAGDLLAAAFMIAACSLTKYYGASLIPLLIVYSLVKKRRPGNWLLFMTIPVIILACYQWLTYKMYGVGLLLDAGTYAAKARNLTGHGVAGDLLTGLSFTGGCLITALILAPLLWKKQWLAGGLAVVPPDVVPERPERGVDLPLDHLHGAEQGADRVVLDLAHADGLHDVDLAALERGGQSGADSVFVINQEQGSSRSLGHSHRPGKAVCYLRV